MTASRQLVVLLLAAALAGIAPAQTPTNPVYVDDSPQAWELFQLARQQRRADNEGEAIRLYQVLLDEFPTKLIPRREGVRDEFLGVRDRVLADIRSEPRLLQRYRLMQTAEAERLRDRGDLAAVARARSLTEPGLDAVLRMAQDALESARFESALAWLADAEDHPDLTPSRKASVWFMAGLSAHYLGRADRRDEALRVLEAVGTEGAACRNELLSLIAGGPGPRVTRGVTPLDRTDAGDLSDIVAQTIWSARLSHSLINRRFSDTVTERTPSGGGFDRKRRQGELTTSIATATDSTVYVNEGHTVRALDRFTGRSRWNRTYRDRATFSVPDGDADEPGDLNVVAVEGDTLVTLTGHATAVRRSSEGQVVCLEADTGQLRWARDLDRLLGDREYEGLFPHGAPILGEGLVFVLGRKVTGQMLTGCYVVALERDDGNVAWVRHIASSGSRARNARPFSTLVLDGGDLFIASTVGAIACVDAGRGFVKWLHRYSVPVNARERLRQPWEMTGPTLAGDRLIALTPDQSQVAVFDRRTGDVLEIHDARDPAGWNAPAYLLTSGAHVYAIGDEIRAFATTDLDRPRWRLPAPVRTRLPTDAEPLPDDAPPEMPSELGLAGRVQVVDGALVVPTRDSLLLIDGETGHIDHRLAIETTGNPLAVGSQLILASADALQSYMSLADAEQMLRARIAATPEDPDAALSLLQLGMRVGELPLALEGARLATIAIEQQTVPVRAADGRRELFEMLLETHRRDIASSERDREALYALIGAVAVTPDQHVEHRLAYGDSLRGSAPGRAVDTYQAILSDPLLAAEVRNEGGLARPAHAWAADRIAALLDRHGVGLYARYAEAAQRLVAFGRTESPPDEDALLAITREFPFAGAAIEAAVLAADAARDRGAEQEGLAILATARDLAPVGSGRRQLVAHLVERCEASGRHGAARAMIEALLRDGDDTPLPTAAGPRAPRDWLAGLTPRRAARRPRIGDSGERPDRIPGQLFRGRLLEPLAEPETAPPDLALLLDGATLTAVMAPALETAWTVELDDPDATLLAIDGDELLLWMGGRGNDPGDPRVVALDVVTGAERWTTPRLADHLDDPLTRARGIMSQLPNGLPFDPQETVPFVGAGVVCLVHRTGGIACFDRRDGHVRWTVDNTLEQVHLVHANEFGILLAGLDRPIDARRTGADLEARIAILDLDDGTTRHRLRPATGTGVLWMTADPLGALVVGTADGLEQYDLLSGRRRWSNVAFATMDARRGWASAGHVVMETRTSSLVSVRNGDGAMSEPFDTLIRGTWSPDALVDVHPLEDGVLAQFGDRIVRYGLAGEVRGADVVAERRDYRALVRGEDRLVVVSQYDRNDAGQRTQRTYRLYVLSPSCRLEGAMIELPPVSKRFVRAGAIDGWIALSTTRETVFVPLP